MLENRKEKIHLQYSKKSVDLHNLNPCCSRVKYTIEYFVKVVKKNELKFIKTKMAKYPYILLNKKAKL